MPPKTMILNSLPSGRTTRPSNKDKHPGEIVKPRPRQKPSEVTQERHEAEEKEKEEQERRTKAIQTAANIEDELANEDMDRESERVAESMARKEALVAKKKYASSLSYALYSQGM
ncbi:hypothetical protein M378DRAFT_176563 [Amanita muscaria Koide BX008]|uniref:Uncharacterized protein n=1 Tax=Amanita muscaria (strain Koide BX008) TaxID=946122 RepID=A0A0C2X459_AMAMK|nr:hypothetical protein M378DRAFT_176563 [Amanita muscaria Koide BX008]